MKAQLSAGRGCTHLLKHVDEVDLLPIRMRLSWDRAHHQFDELRAARHAGPRARCQSRVTTGAATQLSHTASSSVHAHDLDMGVCLLCDLEAAV